MVGGPGLIGAWSMEGCLERSRGVLTSNCTGACGGPVGVCCWSGLALGWWDGGVGGLGLKGQWGVLSFSLVLDADLVQLPLSAGERVEDLFLVMQWFCS